MANTAFEAITSRQAWYANEDLAKYEAVMYDSEGRFVKADGSRPLAGIVEYGGNEGDVVTVVNGAYPGIADGAITEGAYVKPVDGKWIAATTEGDVAPGIALTAAAEAGVTFTVQLLADAVTIAE